MSYEHDPRPEVERHFHIRELIEGQERKAADRNLHRNREKLAAERTEEIRGLKPRDVLPFWCRTCRQDFAAESILEVEDGWPGRIALYRAKCPKGHRCMRLGTDKWRDPYWRRSRKACRDRGMHAVDIIQPHESGYDLAWGHKRRNR